MADQLKVSQGWVRCGHCSEVFDASLQLQPTQSPAAPFQPESTPQGFVNQPQDGNYFQSPDPEPFQPAPQPVAPQELQDDPAWTPGVFFHGQPPVPLSPQANVPMPLPGYGPSSEGHPVGSMPHDIDDPASTVLIGRDQRTAGEYGEAVRVMAAEARAEDTDNHSTPLYMDDSVRGTLMEEPEVPPDVSFVRDARRKAFWRKPGVRVALVLCGLLLGMGLVVQVAVQQRDQIAALQPGLKPWLNALCDQLHCDVGPLRRIEAVVIDSSTFNKMDADSYRLSFSLKNTGATPVAMPSLEVTLTDMQDQAVVRRVLTPAQFGASTTMLTAGADFAGFVVMQVLTTDSSTPAAAASPPLRVAGYRMLAFYP